MSLKAKIEAVIYASEEPVTLAQLVSLLGDQAQAELSGAESAQGSLSLHETETEFETVAEQVPTPGSQGEGAAHDEEHARRAGAEMAVAAQASPDTAGSPGSTSADAARIEGTGEARTAEGDTEAGPEELAPAGSDSAASARADRARVAGLRAYLRTVLDTLIAEYATGDRGLEIREIAGGFRFATKPEYHDAVRGFVRSLKPPLKLTLQSLETLAVVAYKQPVTAPEVSEIRGVDSGGVLGSLIARKLITTAGRKQVIGRPILYKTTREFLLKFGLKDLNELPSIEEFERMAGQMAAQEEIAMPDAANPRPATDSEMEKTADRLEPLRGVHSPQADGEDAPADNLDRVPQEKASVDGRLSSLPPDYAAADAADDPSAQEAEIQEREGH